VNELVRFTELVTALAVAENDILATDIGKHGRADFTCKRSLSFRVEILCPQCHVASSECVTHRLQIRKRRTHGYAHAVLRANSLSDSPGQGSGRGGRSKHLPVAGDESLSHCG